jgi:hypothetical protein
MLITVGICTGSWMVVLSAGLAGAFAYLMRPEDKVNRHCLIEETNIETAARWIKAKGVESFDWPQFVGASRGAAFFLPWYWFSVSDFGRIAVLAYVPLWLLSIPASGVSRHLAYAFILFAPFIVAAGAEWAWSWCLLSWFWPIDFSRFRETTDGKTGFLHARG